MLFRMYNGTQVKRLTQTTKGYQHEHFKYRLQRYPSFC